MIKSLEEQESFRDLVRFMKDPNKRIIPFIGAGLSIFGTPDERLPGWSDLIGKLSERDGINRKTRKNVGNLIDMGFFEYAANEVKKELGDAGLQRALENILDTRDKEIPPAIEMLTNIKWSAIITTNYDDFLKRAISKKYQEFNVITGSEFDNLLEVINNSNKTPTLVHLHGHVDPYKNIILADEDYSRLIENNEAYTKCIEILQSQTVLYLGFGMTDRDFNPILEKMVSLYKSRVGHHYAILPDCLMESEKINNFST